MAIRAASAVQRGYGHEGDSMNVRFSSIALLALISTMTVAQTQSPMRPGSWEVTMKMSMPGMNMEMPPMKQTQCVTADMLKDPQSALPKGPNAGDCKVSNYKFTANTATYTMTCTTPMAMTAVGEMKYNGTDAYTGTITIDSGGQKMSMSYDAKRLGDCAK
jgi:hypothetical protein